jgi:hypothetical protein
MKTDTPTSAAWRRVRPRAAVLAAAGLAGLLGLLASACTANDSPGSGAARTITGTWQGTLHDEGRDRRIVMKVSKRPNSTWKGVLYDVDNGSAALPLKLFTVKGTTITWSLAAPPFSYEGKLSAGGSSVIGTWTGNGADGQRRRPLTFKRANKQTPRASGATDRRTPPNPAGRNPAPKDADEAILTAFDNYELVGLGMLQGDKDLDDFILRLLRDPAFPAKVDDIAVECGNSLYQPLLDRYIAGANVPLSEVRKVWRNTTQPSCGLSAFYESLFPLVRRINQKLPPSDRLRVVVADPPIDWSAVKRASDLRPFMDRDASIASVIEKQVLAKHRKALMIFGESHLMHGQSAVGIYERDGYRGVTFTVVPHVGFANNTPLARYNDRLESRIRSWPVPSLAALPGTWLGNLDASYVFPDQPENGSLSALADAYLYLGPRDLLLGEPAPSATLLDKRYMAELRRRADIVGGPWRPENVLRDAAAPNAFFYTKAALASPSGPEPAQRGRSTRGASR